MISHSPTNPASGQASRSGTVFQTYKRIRAVAGHLRRTAPRVFRMGPRVAAVTVQRLLGRSDYKRWSNPANLETWWDSRTQKLAGFIPPQSRVLEFGAGRRQLPHYLASGCTYFASDLTSRGPDTILCDLNQRPLPDLRHLEADVAVFAGVLEYVSDLRSLATWLVGQTSLIVASYDCVKAERATPARALELFTRSNFGYQNNHTLAELEGIFSSAGFRCVQTDVWDSQEILVFESTRSPIATE